MKFYLASIILLTIIFKMSAEQTNMAYVTDESHALAVLQMERLSEAPKIDAVEKRRETLPAKDFPEGNWGQPFRGFQLSLRFNKDIYTNDEPITAILLLRNITNRFINYSGSDSANNDGPFELSVTTEKGQLLTSPPIVDWIVSAGGGGIPTNTQHKYLEQLNNRYNLTNGAYLVQASLRYQTIKKRSPEGKPIEFEWKQITSAPVQIKIEDSH
ncbi:MAG TPA: hypothetical protein VHY30_02145 [Verrucomicrobiae bacterium]|nr:hypothetical protein [Verrucomicrobiae bacterium]